MRTLTKTERVTDTHAPCTIETYDRGTLTIDTTDYVVTESAYTFDDGTSGGEVWLDGPRGGTYFLRGYTNRAGLFQVISWKSGNPLRRGGNEVHVLMLGDVIEVAPRREPVRPQGWSR